MRFHEYFSLGLFCTIFNFSFCFISNSQLQSLSDVELLTILRNNFNNSKKLTKEEYQILIDEIISEYPNIISKDLIGGSYENNEIMSLSLFKKIDSSDVRYNEILFISMMDGEEFSSLNLQFFFLFKMLQSIFKEPPTFPNTKFLFIPILNPDSYYKNNNLTNNSFYSKNRNIENSHSNCTNDFELGVNLLNNFDFNFSIDELHSSSNDCSLKYRGKFPFSENETSFLKRFIESHQSNLLIINLREGTMMINIPYNSESKLNKLLTTSKYFNVYQDLINYINNSFPIGNLASLVGYRSNGNLIDWALSEKLIGSIEIFSNLLSIDSQIENQIGILMNFMEEFLLRNYGKIDLSDTYKCKSEITKAYSRNSNLICFNLSNLGFHWSGNVNLSVSSLHLFNAPFAIVRGGYQQELQYQFQDNEFKSIIELRDIQASDIVPLVFLVLKENELINFTISSRKYPKSNNFSLTTLNVSAYFKTDYKYPIGVLLIIILSLFVGIFFSYQVYILMKASKDLSIINKSAKFDKLNEIQTDLGSKEK